MTAMVCALIGMPEKFKTLNKMQSHPATEIKPRQNLITRPELTDS
jgi:thymidine kinase